LALNEFALHTEDKAVSKVRDKAIPEPLKKQPFDAEAWFARLEAWWTRFPAGRYPQ